MTDPNTLLLEATAAYNQVNWQRAFELTSRKRGRDNGSSDVRTSLASDMGASEWTASDRALREKNRFWFEKPATRFIVYFCVFVTSGILVGITLHWIFHII